MAATANYMRSENCESVGSEDCDVRLPTAEKIKFPDSAHQGLSSELTLLREATRKAVLESYKEQERLCRRGEMMQSRISYLRAKIEATKSELVLRGKLNQEYQSNTVSAIEEERSGEFTASDTKCDFEDDDMMDVEVQQLAGEKNESSNPTQNLSGGSGIPGLSRGSILSMLGSHSSFSHRSSEKSNTSFNESASSAPRFSFFDDVGMPSRWRAREMERSKQLEDDEVHDQRDDATSKSEDCAEPVNLLATKLRTLISRRESEIAALEKQTKKMEMETTCFHHKMADFQKEHESNMAVSKRERDALLKSIKKLENDNQKLDAQLLEMGVILQEKEISGSLLEKELRDARNRLYELQSLKSASKKKSRLESRASGAQPEQGVQGDVKYQVATFTEEDDDRKFPSRGPQRRGSNNSLVSALTLDFDDFVDILDESCQSEDDFDEILGSLTSSKNSSSLSG